MELTKLLNYYETIYFIPNNNYDSFLVYLKSSLHKSSSAMVNSYYLKIFTVIIADNTSNNVRDKNLISKRVHKNKLHSIYITID